jgi:hypothetical protein
MSDAVRTPDSVGQVVPDISSRTSEADREEPVEHVAEKTQLYACRRGEKEGRARVSPFLDREREEGAGGCRENDARRRHLIRPDVDGGQPPGRANETTASGASSEAVSRPGQGLISRETKEIVPQGASPPESPGIEKRFGLREIPAKPKGPGSLERKPNPSVRRDRI